MKVPHSLSPTRWGCESLTGFSISHLDGYRLAQISVTKYNQTTLNILVSFRTLSLLNAADCYSAREVSWQLKLTLLKHKSVLIISSPLPAHTWFYFTYLVDSLEILLGYCDWIQFILSGSSCVIQLLKNTEIFQTVFFYSVLQVVR